MESRANKYRPNCWAEVIGQNAITSILNRQIITKTFKNSYLFSGPSGCGKTTVARIFANSLNNNLGEPIEIDAASNNGIDSIRALITDSQQSAIDCDYKVYIIDECHQLTRAAWDAALKLIEEPPHSSIFIFCTTNPFKIPETIMSRVQRFDFKRVSNREIADRLEFIMNEELNLDYDRSALERIAIAANGCVRSAIQLLDKCLDYSSTISVSNVKDVINFINYEDLLDIEISLSNKDLNKCISILDKVEQTFANPIQFYDMFISFIIDCEIYSRLKNKNYTSIPCDIIDKIICNNKLLNLLIDSLIKFRSSSNSDNAIVLLKAICIAICNEDKK